MLYFHFLLAAVVFDYLFIVKTLNPSDGYYKLDVYLYYVFTFIIPLFAGWRKNAKTNGQVGSRV